MPVRDMLDVQGVIWALAKWDTPASDVWRGGGLSEPPSSSVATSDGRLAALPAANISYANQILVEIGASEPTTLDRLIEGGDPERLSKSGRELTSPRNRARDLIRFARGLGLLEPGTS